MKQRTRGSAAKHELHLPTALIQDGHPQHAQQEGFTPAVKHSEGDGSTKQRQPVHRLLAAVSLLLQPAVRVCEAGNNLAQEKCGGLHLVQQSVAEHAASRNFMQSTKCHTLKHR